MIWKYLRTGGAGPNTPLRQFHCRMASIRTKFNYLKELIISRARSEYRSVQTPPSISDGSKREGVFDRITDIGRIESERQH